MPELFEIPEASEERRVPRYQNVWNFGQIIQAAAFALSLATIGAIQISYNARIDERVAALESAYKENKPKRDMVESRVTVLEQQTGYLTNQFGNIQVTLRSIADGIAAIRENLAVLNSQERVKTK